MGRYFAWGRCLDCGQPVGTEPFCTHCGLPQQSPEADRLRWLLYEADEALNAARRTAGLPAEANVAPPASAVPPESAESSSAVPADLVNQVATPVGLTAGAPSYPNTRPQPPARRSQGWPSLSTPTVLLGLGAICVVVAAIVFVSVAWSSLSLAAKAAILLTITTGVGALAWWLLRRGLRGSAEALTLLFMVLAVLDFTAAVSGGLAGLDSLSWRAAEWVTTVILLVGGLAWARVAVLSRTKHLTGVQLVAVFGVATGVAITFDQVAARAEYIAMVLVVLLACIAVVGALLGAWTFAVWTLAGTALLALSAFFASLASLAEETTVRGLWGTGAAVGWVICIAVAAVLAATTRLPSAVRTGGAVVAVPALTVLILRPLEGSSYDVVLAVVVATAVFWGAISLVAPSPWWLGVVVTAAPAAVAALGMVAPTVLHALGVVLTPATQAWQLEPTDTVSNDLELNYDLGEPLLVAVAAVAAIAVLSVLWQRRLPGLEVGFIVVASTVGVVAMRYPMTLWGVVAVTGGVALVAGAVSLRWRSDPVGILSAAFVVATLTASLGSALTTLVASAAVAIALAALAWKLTQPAIAALASGGAVALSCVTIVAGCDLADATSEVAAYLLVAFAATTLLSAQLTMRGEPLRPRIGLELGAIVPAVVGLALSLGNLSTTTPISMTAIGASLVVVSLLRTDRSWLRIPGGVLLAGATWVRLATEEVDLVEAYTLPTALVLTALGAWRMWRTPGTSSLVVLSPGLTLALLPSLLVTLPEPTSTRALLLGIGALVVLLAGAILRWVAPLFIGGGVVLVLAVLNIAPYADAVPRWVIFGLAGAALLFLGITWERRLRDARKVLAAVERLA